MPLLLAAYENPKSQRKLTALARERPYLPPGEGIFFVCALKVQTVWIQQEIIHTDYKNLTYPQSSERIFPALPA